jgi:hypothetical protein
MPLCGSEASSVARAACLPRAMCVFFLCFAGILERWVMSFFVFWGFVSLFVMVFVFVYVCLCL